jgi:MFS family permease
MAFLGLYVAIYSA